jgi:hypothetical protein
MKVMNMSPFSRYLLLEQRPLRPIKTAYAYARKDGFAAEK